MQRWETTSTPPPDTEDDPLDYTNYEPCWPDLRYDDPDFKVGEESEKWYQTDIKNPEIVGIDISDIVLD